MTYVEPLQSDSKLVLTDYGQILSYTNVFYLYNDNISKKCLLVFVIQVRIEYMDYFSKTINVLLNILMYANYDRTQW